MLRRVKQSHQDDEDDEDDSLSVTHAWRFPLVRSRAEAGKKIHARHIRLSDYTWCLRKGLVGRIPFQNELAFPNSIVNSKRSLWTILKRQGFQFDYLSSTNKNLKHGWFLRWFFSQNPFYNRVKNAVFSIPLLKHCKRQSLCNYKLNYVLTAKFYP